MKGPRTAVRLCTKKLAEWWTGGRGGDEDYSFQKNATKDQLSCIRNAGHVSSRNYRAKDSIKGTIRVEMHAAVVLVRVTFLQIYVSVLLS